MRYQIGELKKGITSLRAEKNTIWTKVDESSKDVSLLVQKQNVISGMLRPEAVAEQVAAMAKNEIELKYLRRDVDELRGKPNKE